MKLLFLLFLVCVQIVSAANIYSIGCVDKNGAALRCILETEQCSSTGIGCTCQLNHIRNIVTGVCEPAVVPYNTFTQTYKIITTTSTSIITTCDIKPNAKYQAWCRGVNVCSNRGYRYYYSIGRTSSVDGIDYLIAERPAECICDQGWSGTRCENACNSQYPGGVCSNPASTCALGYAKLTTDLVSWVSPPCVLYQCPKNAYGSTCLQCPDCGQGYCDDGVFGTGKCIGLCTTPGWKLNKDNVCVPQHCGYNNSSCNGHGVCDTTGTFEYCRCNAGYTGQYCDIAVPERTDLCDCGVSWQSEVTLTSTLTYGIRLMNIGPGKLLSLTRYPVAHLNHAKWLCYQDVTCDGFIAHTSTGLPTQNYWAYFFNTTTIGIKPTIIGVNDIKVHRILRTKNYPCVSTSLDETNYFNRYKLNITSKCTELRKLSTRLGECDDITMKQVFVSNHYRYFGHQQRFHPNTLCELSPVFYDSSTTSMCNNAVSGCIVRGGEVCSGQGYCIKNLNRNLIDNLDYRCECKRFPGQSNLPISKQTFGYAYIGKACQYNTRQFCTESGINGTLTSNPVLCNGVLGTCKAIQTYTFPDNNVNIDVNALSVDYIPRCNCDTNNEYQGTFCTESRCDVKGCKGPTGSAGICLPTNSTKSLWECTCRTGFLGKYCDIDARSYCNYLDFECAGQGKCREADSSHSTPWCECFAGYTHPSLPAEQKCQFTECTEAVLIPGHGVCKNGAVESCYKYYIGAKCETDTCTSSGGTIYGSRFNTTCVCSGTQSLLLNDVETTSCWPQCPKDSNNIKCGGTQHVCTQTTEGSTRVARCECSQGYFLNTQTGLCEKFCIHGEVTSGFNINNPTPCECVNTGFESTDGDLRCNTTICQNGGQWNNITRRCDCVEPFTSDSNCRSSICVRGTARLLPDNSAGYCDCKFPFKPSNPLKPYDCSANLCPSNRINLVYALSILTKNTLTPDDYKKACYCTGQSVTACTTTPCQLCASSYCLNGGIPDPSNLSVCQCPKAYINGAKGQCECKASTTIAIDQKSKTCICRLGFTGLDCSQQLCINGLFNTNTRKCACFDNWNGDRCDVEIE
jgi:hypothetical protein